MKIGIFTQLMLAALMALSLFATACGDDDGDDTQDTEVSYEPAVGCLTATPLELAVPKLSGAIDGEFGVIDIPGKVEFYQLRVDTATFVRIATDSLPVETDEFIFDPAISLYNADGTELLASATQTFIWASRYAELDAELFYNVTAPTTLCVAVEDVTSWVDYETLAADADFTYQVNATEAANWDKWDRLLAEEGDNNTVANAQELVFDDTVSGDGRQGVACGTFDSATDIDMYRIALDPNTSYDLIVTGLLGETGPGVPGTEALDVGMGSTVDNMRISRLESDPPPYVSSIQSEDGFFMESPATVDPSPTAPSLYLSVEPAAGATLGDNASYCMYWLLEDAGNVWKTIEGTEDNDLPTGAIPLVLETQGGDPFVMLKGTLDSDTDVDYYSFEFAQGESLDLDMSCGASTKGSGLIGTTFSIEDNQGTVLRSETEADNFVLWNETEFSAEGLLSLPSAGTYYLKVDGATQDPNLTANNYTCRLQQFYPR